MTRLFSNDASTTLAEAINAVDDPVTFDVADGTVFPALSGGDTFRVSLQEGNGVIEIMEVTARTGNTLTATRAQEGTTATAYSIGARCEIRTTAGILDSFVQENAPIDMGNNVLSNANADNSCVWNGGNMKAGEYKAQDGSSANSIVVPDGDLPPTIGGERILTAGNLGSTPEADAIYNTVYPPGIVAFFANNVDPNAVVGKPSGANWLKIVDGPSSEYQARYLRVTDNGISSGNGPPRTEEVSNVTLPATSQTSPAGAETGGHALLPDEAPPHFHETTTTQDVFFVRGGSGVEVTGDAGLGIIPANAQGSKSYTSVSNGLPNNTAKLHSHSLPPHEAHLHFTTPEPNYVELVAWYRNS